MTQPLPPDAHASHGGPRLSGGRIFGLALCAALCLVGGRLFQAGFVSFAGPAVCAPSQACHGGLGTLAYWMGGVAVWAVGLAAAIATVVSSEPGGPNRLPFGATVCASLLLGLTGAALGEGLGNPFLTAALVVFAALTVPVAVQGELRLRHERRKFAAARAVDRHLAEHGVSTAGTVTEVQALGEAHQDALDLRITLRFTDHDGTGRTFTHTANHPVHAAPRVGDRLTVRYDPQAPAIARAGAPLPPEPVRDAVPSLTEELARLAALHREGALDAQEFERAKARLLAGR
ncbi:DUF3592 domain-containing protein [Kitasatospora sp. NPDC101183]|uniref:DUF3592 domain-containing protein n=1 Tax=Kitasatospora sp. NPDC101183 TaxID=3364100 RepID=UPI0037F43C0B